MQISNKADGFSIEYDNDGDKEEVLLTSGQDTKFGQVLSGPAFLRRIPAMRGMFYGWDPFMPESGQKRAACIESTNPQGMKEFRIGAPERFPCVGFRVGDLGLFKAPAICLVGARNSSYLWIFFVRSTRNSLNLMPERSLLSVTHGSGQATASLNAHEDGELEPQLTVSGEGYRKAELFIRRNFKDVKSGSFDSLIGESDSEPFIWSPSRNNLDSIMMFQDAMSNSFMKDQQFSDVFGDSLPIFCDGPGIDYSLHLIAHRLISSDEDTCSLLPSPK